MENFEKRKEEYFNRVLATTVDNGILETLTLSLIVNGMFDEIKIINNPENENELTYADATVTSFRDTMLLSTNLKLGIFEPMPIEENMVIKNAINRMKEKIETGTFEPLDINKLSTVEQARLAFHATVVNAYNAEDIGEYVCNALGLDSNSTEDIERVVKFMREIDETTILYNKSDNNYYRDLSSDDLEELRQFAAEYNRLYEKYYGEEKTNNK